MNIFKTKKFKLTVSILLSSIIIFLIYRQINPDEMLLTLKQVKILPFFLFLLMFIPQMFVATFRWNLLTRKLGLVSLSMFRSLSQVIGSYSANLLIPGKMGEIVRLVWMKKYNLHVPVIVLVLLEKILDVLSVIILMIIAGVFFFIMGNTTSIYYKICYALFSLGLIFIIIFYWNRNKLLSFLKAKKISNIKFIKIIIQKIDSIMAIRNKQIPKFLAISLILWIIQILEFYFIFLMFDINIPIFQLFFGISIALLAGALPISVAGIGTRDAIIVSFFGSFASMEVLAGVGIISLFRIIIPAVAGLPFFIHQTKE